MLSDSQAESGAGSSENQSQSEIFQELTQPAKLAMNAVRFLRENPFVAKDEMEQAAGLNDEATRSQYPELGFLVNYMLQTREDIVKVHKLLKRSTVVRGRTVAETLFIAAAGQTPVEKPEMSYLNDPFAICITVQKGDFSKLHSIDAGGFFQKNMPISLDNTYPRVPFIALKGAESHKLKRTYDHEHFHAHNEAVRQALLSAKKSNLWGAGDFSPVPNFQINLITEFLDGQANALGKEGIPLNGILGSPNAQRILSCQESLSKDESLTRFVTTQEGFTRLSIRGGSYDVIKDFHFKNETVGALLWEESQRVTLKGVEILKNALLAYRAFGLIKKQELLPWILMRVPMQDWRSTLYSSGIYGEIVWLNSIAAYLQRINADPDFNDKDRLNKAFLKYKESMSAKGADALLFQEIQALNDELGLGIRPHQ